MLKNMSLRDYTPSRSNTPQTTKTTTPTKIAPPPKVVATTTTKPISDSVQISSAAQQAYKKDIEKPSVQARINPEGAGAGGGSSTKPKNETKPTNSNSGVKESKDKDSKDPVSKSVSTVVGGAATGAVSGVIQEYKDYKNREKVAEAAKKMNGPAGTPRIAPADPIKGGIRGAGIGVAVGTLTEVGKNIYNHYDNISKTQGFNEATAQAVEDGFLAPSEPYASMPTPQEIRNSKNKRDHDKESIKDHLAKEVKEAVDRVRDFFKW
ncbi:hypothetical protein P9578_15095 [Brevibacillus choshinensis]|uniref:hypothetical protein n=1 Tax=Brevibacillus choshinensis TaxID=54911 RepID=UPI002E237697|nr:hypothetical protein [Brevibacillus choshinensis]